MLIDWTNKREEGNEPFELLDKAEELLLTANNQSAGEYECHTENQFGSIAKKVRLTLKGKRKGSSTKR
jgi:hypothetical protein